MLGGSSRLHGLHRKPEVELTFPGDEIPSWFSLCNLGNTISVNLPWDFLNNPSKGLVVCAVLSHVPKPSMFCFSWSYNILSTTYNSLVGFGIFCLRLIDLWLIGPHSPTKQMYLGYVSSSHLKSRLPQNLVPENVLKWVFTFDEDSKTKVKSCGVHLIDVENGHVNNEPTALLSDSRVLAKRPHGDVLGCSSVKTSNDDDKSSPPKRFKTLEVMDYKAQLQLINTSFSQLSFT